MNQSAKDRKELLERFDANVPTARAVLGEVRRRLFGPVDLEER